MTTTTTAFSRHRTARRVGRPRAARLRPLTGTSLLLVGTVVVLNIIGVVMVLSASSVVSLTTYGSAWYFFVRQIVWTLLGAAGFVIAMRTDYHQWRRWIRPLLIGSAGLLLLVLLPGIGSTAGGAQRWLGIGIWRFQPTELAKLALLLYAADLLTRRESEVGDWRVSVRPVLLVLAGFGGLICLQPDLDSALLLGVIVMSILVVGGVRLWHLFVVGGSGVALVGALAISASYRRGPAC